MIIPVTIFWSNEELMLLHVRRLLALGIISDTAVRYG